jgi:U3 small nucleolar RNA-associated protein 5
VQHTGFLLSQPALVANLEALYTVIDSRVAVYKKLLKLSGRLDLLMSQLPSEHHHHQLQGRSGGGPSRISAKALRRAKLTVEQTALEEKIVAKRRIEELKEEEEDEDDEGEEDEEDEIDEDIDEEDEDEDED